MRNHLLTIVALSVMTLNSAPAGADGKTFPGAFCQASEAASVIANPYGFAGTGGGRPPDQDVMGGLFNTSINFNRVSCPIVRDITRGQSDGINFARMHVFSNGAAILCTLFSRTKTSPTAMVRTVEFASNSSRGETGDQQLDYPSLDSGLRGYYHFGCSIPPSNPTGISGIWFYDVSEKD